MKKPAAYYLSLFLYLDGSHLVRLLAVVVDDCNKVISDVTFLVAPVWVLGFIRHECCHVEDDLHELIVPGKREVAVLPIIVQPSQVSELRVTISKTNQVTQAL